MWVFIRPQGGQDCYLLRCELRGVLEFCPIHRFDGMDQIPEHWGRAHLIEEEERIEDRTSGSRHKVCE
jgi:hypothetical protein